MMAERIHRVAKNNVVWNFCKNFINF